MPRRRLLVAAVLAAAWFAVQPSTAALAGGAPIAFERDGDLFSLTLGASPRRVTATRVREHEPAWDPDHRRLAFAVWGRRVGILDLGSGAQRRVAQLPERIDRIEDLAWSPDGRRIAVATTNEFRRGGTHMLSGSVWVVDVRGGAPATIVTGQAMVTGLGWSVDGLFASTEWPNGVELWRPAAPLGVIAFDDDGTTVRLVEQTTASHLDLSQDGRRIVFRGWIHTCHACGEIWRMAAGGSGPHVIAMPPDDLAGLASPRFSPAGTRIAAIGMARRTSLWVMRADGSRPHRVLANVGSLDW